MSMAPRLRKLALTAHVACSVGWLGAVVGFLALAVAGVTSRDVRTAHALDLAMAVTGWFVIVPLCLASLLTGVVQSLGTPWGLIRHYWVVFKLLINVLATIVLLMYMRTTGGGVSAQGSPAPVLHAGVTVLLLIAATALSVHKPQGVTPYGVRKQRARAAPTTVRGTVP
jgi:hypothetical protein